MIDAADQYLRDWCSSILPDVTLTFEPPNDQVAEPTVSIYLLELQGLTTHRPVHQPAHTQISLRYLVSARAEDAVESHRVLGRLLSAAIEHPEFEVDLSPLPADIWNPLGVRPGPVFVLEVPVRQERAARTAPMVHAPLVVEQSPTGSLEGVVLGSDDVPIADAQVEIPGLARVVRTDRSGRFRFGLVPTGNGAIQLKIEARGRSLEVTTSDLPRDQEQLVIRFGPPGR